MAYKLGKRPARKGSIAIAFGDVFDRSALPTPPLRFGHESIGQPWGMLGNDNYSNCVFAGAAHEHMVWTHEGGIGTARFDQKSVLSDYSAVTGFDPNNPDSDAGTDMQQAAEYRRKVGVIDEHGVRHKIDAYVSLRAGNVEDILLATYLLGAVGIGLNLPLGAMDAFDAGKPWTDIHQPVDGGHYVPCIGRNSAGNILIVTWGRIQAMTPAFCARYCDEAIAYLSLEMIRQSDKVSPEGFDEAALRSNLHKLSSKPHA